MSSAERNALGQPVGLAVDGDFPRPRPPRVALTGRYGSLVPLDPAHAPGLHAAMAEDREGRGWTYLSIDGWAAAGDAADWIDAHKDLDDPLFYTVLDPAGTPLGFCAYLRIQPAVGSIEVGSIHFAPAMRRTRLATEAMFLMMRHAFDDLGYRRYEWKCDALNAPSRAAAGRFGFTYEGTHRQATITKGRNRDTAWFSILDGEWPDIRRAFEAWLAADNFTPDGTQRSSLAARRNASP